MGQLSTNINVVEFTPNYIVPNGNYSVNHIFANYFFSNRFVFINGSCDFVNNISSGIDSNFTLTFPLFQQYFMLSCLLSSNGIQGNNHYLYGIGNAGQTLISAKMDSNPTSIEISYSIIGRI